MQKWINVINCISKGIFKKVDNARIEKEKENNLVKGGTYRNLKAPV